MIPGTHLAGAHLRFLLRQPASKVHPWRRPPELTARAAVYLPSRRRNWCQPILPRDRSPCVRTTPQGCYPTAGRLGVEPATSCDPVWHVSFGSGEACLRTVIFRLLYFKSQIQRLNHQTMIRNLSCHTTCSPTPAAAAHFTSSQATVTVFVTV